MTPFYSDDWLTLYGGDCREVLRALPSESVDCVVTSPPYWGLRDYGSEGQLGLERTPEEYVANMVEVFREVRRVLKPSGTCWLNLGDSYAGPPVGTFNGGGFKDKSATAGTRDLSGIERGSKRSKVVSGLKPKDLVGIPWRVAFALQADGWYLRSDIIWSKPNPMPESVTDRPTKSHEYLFLLTKQARYYFDADAVRETAIYEGVTVKASNPDTAKNGAKGKYGATAIGFTQHDTVVAGRNIRSVWSIATRPYPAAHFAVFPPELPERCIKAGSTERGVCPECGAPWERVVGRTPNNDGYRNGPGGSKHRANPDRNESKQPGNLAEVARYDVVTTGWRPACNCNDGVTEATRPAVVLDPFGGSGTVGMVANRLSRRAILIDLNPEYLKQQMRRNAQTPLGLTEGAAS